MQNHSHLWFRGERISKIIKKMSICLALAYSCRVLILVIASDRLTEFRADFDRSLSCDLCLSWSHQPPQDSIIKPEAGRGGRPGGLKLPAAAAASQSVGPGVTESEFGRQGSVDSVTGILKLELSMGAGPGPTIITEISRLRFLRLQVARASSLGLGSHRHGAQ